MCSMFCSVSVKNDGLPMESPSDNTDFAPSFDLWRGVGRYLRLLDRVHIRNVRPDPDKKLLNNAVLRYEQMWLPILASEEEASDLAPPWDVYYVWCLHILSGGHYWKYCTEHYERVLPHTFHPAENVEDKAQLKAKEVWEDRFPEEPFHYKHDSPTQPSKSESPLLELIKESELRQDSFYYQVALPHFRDPQFQENAVKRYISFMSLRRDNPNVVLLPTHDIELVRRTHMLHPIIYAKDLENFMGSLDDLETSSSYDDNEEGKWSSLETTSRLWAATFHTNYRDSGIKGRGQQITEPLREATRVHLKQSEPEVVDLTLDDICISDLWSNDRKITVELRRLGETSFSYHSVFRLPGKSGQTLSTKNIPGQGKTEFNLRSHRGIELHTYGNTGRFCTQVESHLDTTFFDPRSLFAENQPAKSTEQVIEVPRISFGDPRVSFKCQINVTTAPKPYVFSLLREPFAPGRIPPDLKPFIKIPAWSDVGLFNMDTFSSARHQ